MEMKPTSVCTARGVLLFCHPIIGVIESGDGVYCLGDHVFNVDEIGSSLTTGLCVTYWTWAQTPKRIRNSFELFNSQSVM
jgi:hypothetical protein